MLKKLTALLLAGLTAAAVTGCGGTQPQNTGDSGTPKQAVRLVLDWTPNTNHTGFYAAQALGYYEEAGLDVEIMLPPEGSAPVMVASGGADFGINAQDTLAPAFLGEDALPITAVAALLQHNTSGILSLKENGMETPKSLEGKTYATWDNPVEQAIIRSVMETDGGDFSKLTMIPSTVTDVVTALQTDVDAVWIFYAWDGIAAQLKGLETNFIDFAKLDSRFDYYTPVLFANNSFLEQNPDTAKAFLKATAKGYEYAIEHPQEAAKILLEASPELDPELVLASQEWISAQYKADTEQWGYIDPVRWNGFYTWLSENHLVDGELPEGTGFTNAYLE